jgi:hypothetical protein
MCSGDCVVSGGGGGGGSTGSIGIELGDGEDCDEMKTADVCTAFVKSFSSSGMASSSTTTTVGDNDHLKMFLQYMLTPTH